MSVNVRFTTGGVYYKAWIYERASSKGTCVICGNESHDNILIRHKEPKKIIGDTHICHKCLVLISNRIQKAGDFEPPVIKKRVQKKPGRPKKRGTKKGTKPKKFQCKYCDKMIAKANVTQHMKFSHPEVIYETLIENLIIEDNTDAEIRGPEEGNTSQEA